VGGSTYGWATATSSFEHCSGTRKKTEVNKMNEKKTNMLFDIRKGVKILEEIKDV
jgi:hypothetical protein